MTNEKLDQARAEEAWNIYNRERKGDVSAIAARLAREGWTPPAPVDPDEAEADKMWEEWGHRGGVYLSLMAIKRGRALAAEAKPGMVWVKNSGLSTPDGVAILTINECGYFDITLGCRLSSLEEDVAHYAVITPPEDVA